MATGMMMAKAPAAFEGNVPAAAAVGEAMAVATKHRTEKSGRNLRFFFCGVLFFIALVPSCVVFEWLGLRHPE